MKFFAALVIGMFCFGLGYFVARSTPESEPTVSEPNQDIAVESFIQTIQQKAQTQPEDRPALQQQLKKQKTQVNSLIDQATPEQINKYLQQVFPDYDLSHIHDKHAFAKRLVGEFVDAKNDPHERMTGQASVTAQQQYMANDLLPRQVYAGQQLFAHFDTLGKTPNNEQVFVRWSHQSTGEVLFFMPQRISANREQNWVSFKPAKGWKAGSYDVKYYQLNDQLVPIAQTSFTIDQVMD
jgi:LysM repeat protein